jgi:acetyl-CoA carboxylase carboxyl transferase subunit alpha
MVRDFCELHGDQRFGDDRAMLTGFGEIGSHRVMIIGQNRGRQIPERVAANFGCPHPEGYRKALAKMKLAAKYGLPIVSLIDTPGAYPGVEAEQRGMAAAIADNLMAMPRLPVPLVAVVIGEGGSGGALGIGVADRLAMFEHSVFSVISPEGCAAILWNTSEQAKAAASALRMRAGDLLELGMIDEIIPEPAGAAHRDPAQAARSLERFVCDTLTELCGIPIPLLLEQRYQRLRTMGASFERIPAPCAAEPTVADPRAADARPPVRRAAG